MKDLKKPTPHLVVTEGEAEALVDTTHLAGETETPLASLPEADPSCADPNQEAGDPPEENAVPSARRWILPTAATAGGIIATIFSSRFIDFCLGLLGAACLGTGIHFPHSHASPETPLAVLIRQISTGLSPLFGAWLGMWWAARRFGLPMPIQLQSLIAVVAPYKIPILIFFFLACFPKMVILWGVLLAAYTIGDWVWPHLPPSVKQSFSDKIPTRVRNSPDFKDLMEGLSQCKPYVILGTYIFCAPLALIGICCHWLYKLFRRTDKRPIEADNAIEILQNPRKNDEHADNNFYHSPIFSLTCLAVFASGAPALLNWTLYNNLGIDQILGYPSDDPEFSTIFLVYQLYLASIGWCIGLLLIRTWMSFPCNFDGEEHKIDISATGLKRTFNSWLVQVSMMNLPWLGKDNLAWNEIKYISCVPRIARLTPLPTNLFAKETKVYRVLNRLAEIVDSCSPDTNFDEYLHFRTQETGGEEIKVRLSDLNGDERARLYYAIKTWAPHLVLGENVQRALTGAVPLQAPRYTQIWFNLLMEKSQSQGTGPLAPDEMLNNNSLKIIRHIAAGGQANVYEGELNGEIVIVKEFILSNCHSLGALVGSGFEFETESALLSQLQHPRIIQLRDFFAENRRAYIVLEKAAGTSLRRLVKSEGKQSECDTVNIALQLCGALKYLHDQQPTIVHRDVSPDNIMFDPANGIKLIDFSLAASGKSRRTTTTLGKHCYAPPEQIRDQPVAASDIYALGATMYFLLTGKDPNPITQSDVSLVRASCSPELVAIIKQATAFEVSDRFPSIEWMQLELEKLRKDVEYEA